MRNTAILSLFLASFFAFPALSLACTTSAECGGTGFWCNPDTQQCVAIAGGTGTINTSYIQGYSSSIIGIINGILVPVLMAIAFIVFLYGVYKYFIFGAADESAHEEGRVFVLYGIIGFVVILSVWGLVGILGSTLGLSAGGSAPAVPTL